MSGAVTKYDFGDQFNGKLPAPLSREELKAFSRLNPWRTCAGIAVEWGGILAAIALCTRFWNPLLYFVAVLWIAARQHALTILMHEGVHYRISKNRKFNEIISEVLCAWPIFITMRGFRRIHFAHHKHTNTEKDPDWNRKKGPKWTFPKSRGNLFWLLAKDAIGLNGWFILAAMIQMSMPERTRDGKIKKGEISFQIARFSFYGLVGWAIYYFGVGKEFLLYWMIPMFTWFVLALHIRSIAEHHNLEYTHPYSHTRTTIPTVLDRLFLIPKNISFHIEHHLYPSVPYFRLPALSRHLRQNDPEFQQHAHVTHGYWNVLKEFCAAPTHPEQPAKDQPAT